MKRIERSVGLSVCPPRLALPALSSMKAALLLALACTAAFAAATSPPTFAELAKRADAARAANHLPDAVRLYQEALKLNGTWKEGWWNLGTLLYDIDQYSDARDALRRVVALQNDSG